ncbi:2-phosphosulfolactate phosphatase, putative [Acaryochloris marina MBIC11017]|uniref:Probable 2-phosphosulfolactate phosphatase n=1 Tax=Acaryochloris marina (strain MBIC 11017) TaxID=329726 RepID=B0C3E8_ACAM1|nr:2-phosphosulfolactate phosphatase, putative [Acaryochloris marina MBIC11017]
MKIFVYHTPEEIPNNRLPGCAVVIDVLRASSTIAAAINAGASAVQVFSDIEPLLEASETVEEDKRIRAGERGGRKVKACEFGNSPLAFTPENTEGRRLFLSTTNGTRCSESVRNASKVIMASLTNRQAVVNYLATKRPGTVWLVGSGWEGSYSLEDTVCAGAIIDGILAVGKTPLSKLAGNDEAIAAVSLFRQWQDQLLELLTSASHGQRLLKMRGKADVAYCSQLDVLDTLPIQKGLGIFVQRKPGVIEKTCEFLGRLVGRKPVNIPAVANPDVEAPAPEAKAEAKKPTTSKKAAAKVDEKAETPKAEAKPKGKDTPAPKVEAKPKAKGPAAKSLTAGAPKGAAPPKAKTEVKPKVEAKPQAKAESKPSSQAAEFKVKPESGSKGTSTPTPKAASTAPSTPSKVEVKDAGEKSTSAVKVESKGSEDQSKKPVSASKSDAPTASEPKVEKSKTDTPKAKSSAPKTPKVDSKEVAEKGEAMLNDVKGLWAKMTKPKPGYERVPGKKEK